MIEHLISLKDGTEKRLVADYWSFDSEDNMTFYKDDEPIFSRQWKQIISIYSRKVDGYGDKR